MKLDKNKYLLLKGSRKKIADALLEDPEKFLFLDIEEIAQELRSTPSTLSRVVRALGFLNFKDFRSWIAQKSGLVVAAQESGQPKSDSLLQDELKGLESLSNPGVLKAIEEAAAMIDQRGSVILAGFGIGTPAVLVDLLDGYLKWLGITTRTARNSKLDALAASRDLGDDTIFFLIDTDKPFRDALASLDIFSQRGIPRISLTSAPLSRIGIMSSLVIPVRIDRRFFIPPLAPFTAAIDLLTVRLAQLRKKQAHRHRQWLDAVYGDLELVERDA